MLIKIIIILSEATYSARVNSCPFFWQISTYNLCMQASILTPEGTTITFLQQPLLVLFVAKAKQLGNALSWMKIIYLGMTSCTVALIDEFIIRWKDWDTSYRRDIYLSIYYLICQMTGLHQKA